MAKVTIANLNTLLDAVVTSNIAVQTAQTAVTNATVQAGNAATSAQAAALSKSQIDQQVIVAEGLADDVNANMLATDAIKDVILALEVAIGLKADQVTLDKATVAAMLDEVLTAKSGVDVKAELIEELVEDFHTKYLGALLVAPTVSWGGMELATGMLYYDIAKNSLMIYVNANIWVPILETVNVLVATNNLSDILDKAIARTNLEVMSTSEVEAQIQVDIAAIKGQPLGLAELDAAGLVPAAQLPSYVDDVIEVATYANLPVLGESGKIYVVVADETSGGGTNSYRWTGTTYAMISNSLTAADVKLLYESNLDTNAYTDAEKLSVGVNTTLNTTATTLPTAINEVHGEVDAHLLDTSVHGVTEVIGAIETQTLTNKTIDDVNNWIGANHIHYNIKALENLPAGAVVMGMGYNSGEDVFEVSKWTVASGKPALGMNHHTLLTGEIGFIAQSGQIKDIDTSLLTVGTVYYPADGGLLTATKPTTGSYQAAVYVLRSHSSQGAVTVNFAAPIAIASTTQAGYTQLNDTLTSTSTTEALTAAQGKALQDGKQPIDATLTALAGVAVAADKLIYATGVDTFGTATISAYGRSILDDVDAETARTTLEISATNTPSIAVGGVTATNVQAAIQELDSKKANLASPVITGVPEAPTAAVGTNTTQLATTAFVSAEIANDVYSKTQLDAGQLDNRYYTESEIDAKLEAQNDASKIVVVPTGNLASTNVQAALVELQGDIDNRYTKSETTTLLAGKVDTTTNQTIEGIKTFSSSPIVPTPTTDTQAVNKVYVDNQIANRKTIFTGAYGLDWNETTDTYTRTGSDNYLAIQSLIRRCVLKADGTVNYYLHPDNSNFKEDGTPSKLDGTDGNVMVEVPKFYYKHEYVTSNGNIIHRHSVSLTPKVGYEVYWSHMHPTEKAYRYYPAYQGYNSGGVLKSISGVYPTTNQSIATFRSQAAANGSGWHQLDFSLYEALTLLCIIEYGTMNIQGALGQGRTMLSGGSWTGGSLIGITGLSNSLGNKSGNYTFAGSADAPEADLSFMSYRGCENFFGNVWRFADGINATGANSKTIYVNNNPATYASDVFTGDYYSTGVVTAGASGYARKLGNSNKGFFPTDVTGGASNIGTTDYYYTSATVNTIALVGGDASNALAAGPLTLYVTSASSLVSVTIGSGVAR